MTRSFCDRCEEPLGQLGSFTSIVESVSEVVSRKKLAWCVEIKITGNVPIHLCRDCRNEVLSVLMAQLQIDSPQEEKGQT